MIGPLRGGGGLNPLNQRKNTLILSKENGRKKYEPLRHKGGGVLEPQWFNHLKFAYFVWFQFLESCMAGSVFLGA